MSRPVPAKFRRAFEFAVYVPFGLLAYARDVAPTVLTILVARGRGEVDRQVEEVAGRVRHVKAFGDAAIAFGLPHRRRAARAGGAAPEAPAAGEHGFDRAGSQAGRDRTPPTEPMGPAGAAPGNGSHRDPSSRAAADALAIPGYDVLSASQVVARLTGLDREQLDLIRAYEAAHRNRQTILGKIDQLTA